MITRPGRYISLEKYSSYFFAGQDGGGIQAKPFYNLNISIFFVKVRIMFFKNIGHAKRDKNLKQSKNADTNH